MENKAATSFFMVVSFVGRMMGAELSPLMIYIAKLSKRRAMLEMRQADDVLLGGHLNT